MKVILLFVFLSMSWSVLAQKSISADKQRPALLEKISAELTNLKLTNTCLDTTLPEKDRRAACTKSMKSLDEKISKRTALQTCLNLAKGDDEASTCFPSKQAEKSGPQKAPPPKNYKEALSKRLAKDGELKKCMQAILDQQNKQTPLKDGNPEVRAQFLRGRLNLQKCDTIKQENDERIKSVSTHQACVKAAQTDLELRICHTNRSIALKNAK